MKIPFYKYQGTGNDFVIIDNREMIFPKENHSLIAKLCNRRYGIGADGLLLLENSSQVDFTMIYYNADGQLGSMCGNGGRCIVHFANLLKVIGATTVFEAIDGNHKAFIKNNIVSLKMNDVNDIKFDSTFMFLDTGSPHHVEMVNDLKNYNVDKKGSYLRNHIYGKEGSNINFVEQLNENSFAVRTYERGVEAETLSCGTGVTAVAIAMNKSGKTKSTKVQLKTEGGDLSVKFENNNSLYSNIYLEGPATLVFKGIWVC